MLLAWLIFFCLLGAAAVVGYRELVLAKDREAKESPVASQGTPAPAAASAQATAGTDASGLALEAKGYIIPAQQVLVSPKVSGMIEKLFVVEGQRVQKGAVLAELEKTEYQSDVQRFQAMLDAAKERYTELERGFRDEEIHQAEAELGEAKVQRAQAETEWERTSQLRSQQAISQEEYDAALSQRDALDQRVRRLEFAAQSAEAGAARGARAGCGRGNAADGGRTRQSPMAAGQLHDPSADLRDDTQEERGGREHRQLGGLQRIVQCL